MDQPDLYARANKVQRQDAERIVSEFKERLKLNLDGRESLLDIGCGSGDVLIDFIYPILPNNYSKVVGVDISPEMIEYATKTYASYEKIEFKVLDIAKELPVEYHGKFDHVTSFYALHWVQNQKKAVQNIYKALRKNGNCLLVLLGTDQTFDTFKPLSLDYRFADYMRDVDDVIPPYHMDPSIESEYTTFLKEAGFVDLKLELRECVFFYDSAEIFKENMKAVNPFVNRLPNEKQDEYMNALVEQWKSAGLCLKIDGKDDYKFSKPYTLLVAFGRKK